MTDRKPLVAIDGRVYQQPYTSNLSVPGSVTLDYGNVEVDGRYLPRWGVPQRDRCSGAWSVRTASSTTRIWSSICWSPDLGLFCAVAESGTGGRVMTSPDGITWTARTNSADNGWVSVCWSPQLKLFCAVANTGPATVDRVMTSPDGVTWTSRSYTGASSGVCWSPHLSLFCAVGASAIGTSSDGITWTSRSLPVGSSGWKAVCWAPELGLFCSVTNGSAQGTNRVMTSPDGITWTTRTAAADLAWNSVCWSPELSLFCAVANDALTNTAMTSPDGITWTSRTVAANGWTGVCWAPEIGLFCAVGTGGTGTRVTTSPDGITWTTRTSAADVLWSGVCWSAELGFFCAVARNANCACSPAAYPPLYSETNAVYFPSVGTTASAANTFLNSASVPANQLLRSTSSLRYKTDIEDLDAAHADAILQLRPVWYRSLADADRKEWSWYGLIAEEVAEVEPRLVHYANDGEGNLIPDGVQYDRLGVLMLDVIQRERAKMDDLEARLFALENG